jgi:hypothetical protein
MSKSLPLEFAIQLQFLRDLCVVLPPSIPIGQPECELGIFGGQPSAICPGLHGDDLWESIDPILNKVIGYNRSAQELAKLVTTGRYGLLGLHNTFVWQVEHGGVGVELLEGKLDKVVDATKRR